MEERRRRQQGHTEGKQEEGRRGLVDLDVQRGDVAPREGEAEDGVLEFVREKGEGLKRGRGLGWSWFRLGLGGYAGEDGVCGLGK